MYDLTETIVAPASAAGRSATAIIRLSGSTVADVLNNVVVTPITLPRSPTVIPAQIVLQEAQVGNAVTLDVQLWVWPTTRSYTRQPMIEVHLPGALTLVELVISRFLTCGARLAEPGEFTLRAFLAGRVDLLQAEAVLGVIDARDEKSFRAALGQLAGGVSHPLEQLRSDLLDLLADLEAGLDFVDEDLEFVSSAEVQRRLQAAGKQLHQLLDQLASRDAQLGLPRVVLMGLPNAGKSQLFNALLGSNEALVSPVAGTTRDFLRGIVVCDGLRVELVDTAGLSQSLLAEESIELLAQAQTQGQLAAADLQIFCYDLTAAYPSQELDSLIRHQHRPRMIIGTKADLTGEPLPNNPYLLTSALSGVGLAELSREIAAELRRMPGEIMASSAARCRGSLVAAREALDAAFVHAQQGNHDEWLAADLRAALTALGHVTGAVQTNDLLDRIFSRFCIGK